MVFFLWRQWESPASALTVRPPADGDADVKSAMENWAWYLVSLSSFPSQCILTVSSCSPAFSQRSSNYMENVVLAELHQQVEDAALCRSPVGIYCINDRANTGAAQNWVKLADVNFFFSCRIISAEIRQPYGWSLLNPLSRSGMFLQMRILTQVSSGSQCAYTECKEHHILCI